MTIFQSGHALVKTPGVATVFEYKLATERRQMKGQIKIGQSKAPPHQAKFVQQLVCIEETGICRSFSVWVVQCHKFKSLGS